MRRFFQFRFPVPPFLKGVRGITLPWWRQPKPVSPPPKPPTPITPTHERPHSEPAPYSPPTPVIAKEKETMLWVRNPDGVTQWIPARMFASLTGYTLETSQARARAALAKISDYQLAEYGYTRQDVPLP